MNTKNNIKPNPMIRLQTKKLMFFCCDILAWIPDSRHFQPVLRSH